MAFGRGRDQGGERSADERARAAAERAARRAQAPPPRETFGTEPVGWGDEPVPDEPTPDRRDDAYDDSWDEPAREPTPIVTAVQDRPPAPRRVPSSRRPVRRRPPPRRRGSGSWGRRILAVLALIAIPAALYLINAIFQP